jgi:2'-phosphotransferase
MKRNHIHFAQGLPGTKGVISGKMHSGHSSTLRSAYSSPSGMRSQADVMIYVDIAKALTDSYKFFVSSNNVVLCAGNEKGFLPPEYFLRVETAWKGYALPGYEGKRERTGKAKLKEHDEKHEQNLKDMGRKPGRKFKWEDPVKDLLEGDSWKKKEGDRHSDEKEES